MRVYNGHKPASEMTKREFFAAMFLAKNYEETGTREMCDWAVEYADRLLRELETQPLYDERGKRR